MKKLLKPKIILPFVAILLIINVWMAMLAGIMGAIAGSGGHDCGAVETTSSTSDSTVSSADGSIDDFVKKHKESYILSWRAGGFLPSASITQTMIENGFNFTNPNGTSFWMAHNMGGVKTSRKSDFPVTIATYGEDSIDLTGTKPGANVGDGTGGAYTWFSSYDAGIVGKAEFMAHQTLYKGAINNINGIATLSAIANGGWATDGTYKSKLTDMYQKLGTKYQWLDKEAIAAHGEKPYEGSSTQDVSSSDSAVSSSAENSGCGESGSSTDGTGAVPSDATAWGYKTEDLPDSLKSFIIDPKSLGMDYAKSTGWYNPGSDEYAGQCVNLTISLGNQLWGHSGSVQGDGKYQAAAWAAIFGNSVKTTPKKGAIFSTQVGGGGYGHTGIVCHVFENGSILFVEQNTPLSGWDQFKTPYTWNYRIWTKSQQQEQVISFAYPDDREAKLSSN